VTPHPYLDGTLPIGFAHRGGAAVGDENTAAAFGRAVALGYRYIETDTHATSDGVAVVFHDDTLDRLLGRPGRMSDVTWADVRSLRVGGAAVVPRLDEVLDAWPGIRFNIDTKTDAAVAPALDALRRTSAEDRVLLASFSERRLRGIRRATGPRVATSLGMAGVAALLARAWRKAPDGVVAVQVPPSSGPVRVVGAGFIRYAHRLGLHVHVWTIDEAERIGYFLDLGVDGIMTDHIEVLRDVYLSRGLWNPSERP
jgi:glycerophosphoryl diester phosphodiesterase